LREKEAKNVSTNEECRYLIVSAKKTVSCRTFKGYSFLLGPNEKESGL